MTKFITVADILAEIDDARPMMTERAAWFRQMLENAIANCEQKIRFFRNFKEDASIVRQNERIERYQEAIDKLVQKVAA